MQYKDLKDLLNLQLSFCLYSQDACYQPDEAKPAIQALESLHQRVCQSVMPVIGDLPKNDTYLNAEVYKMTANVHIRSLSDKVDDQTRIYTYDNDNNSLNEVTQDLKTINDYNMLLRNKKMDMVLYVDSCSVKKQGRDITVIPKIMVHQIVIYDYLKKKQ